jgi:hypothetical protein
VYYIHFKYIILYKQLDVNAEVSRVFIGVGHYILWKILFDIIGRRARGTSESRNIILYLCTTARKRVIEND